MIVRHVAIVGAGFSGTLQAINLLRHDGPRATLIERAVEPGKGLAYGAAHPGHVLNVRAGNMSALPDDPGHFVRWLAERGSKDAGAEFVERITYGVYLREMLDRAIATSADRLTVRRGDVTDLDCDDGGGTTLTMDDGTTIAADAAVLAVGNLPPHDPPGFGAGLSPDCYKSDPWDASVPAGLAEDDMVLLIGTGLTMVDIALMLDQHGFGGRIVALSRRGLLPRRHAAPGPSGGLAERPSLPASELVRSVRARGDAIGWRAAVDELRPYTQSMWANVGEDGRQRFLRHLRPWWDVHRHRLAPGVADRLAAMQDRGQLDVVAAKTIGAEETGEGVAVTWRPRGTEESVRRVFQRVVNCTGPQGDLMRTAEPLLARLRNRGMIRPDPARLGIDVDNCARTIAAGGLPNQRLYALGPMTRGAFWEIVAVPDIRQQTWNLARRLSNAQWVEGEGL